MNGAFVSRVALACALALSVVGCDGGQAPPADGGTDAPSPPDAWVPPDAWSFAIAPHGPGTVVPDQGGARLMHPQLVIITFADDPNRATLEAHAAWVASSSWLPTVGAEYGVGAATILANVRRTDAAPNTITTAGIEALLSAGVADHSLPRAADGTFHDVLYVIYFPQHTSITDPMLGDSCVSYGGYHYEIANGGSPFSYAVIPNCTAFNPALTPLEFEEEAMTHEVIEAATDALPTSDPAFEFSQSGLEYSPWLFVGPELADLCALHVSPNAYVREGEFVATRMWSNAAAAAGDRDPCIPAQTALPYYTVSVSPDTAQYLAAGTSRTFALDAWTTGPMADFQLYPVVAGGTLNPNVSIDQTLVNNGDHATLTVTMPAGATSGYALIYVETVVSMSEFDAIPVVVYIP